MKASKKIFQKPFLIGVAGGTGSGKTTVVKNLLKILKNHSVVCISHDDYYNDQSQMTMAERIKANYDHPSALETSLLISHLQQLLAGKSIQKPLYDFIENTRRAQTEVIQPCPVIIVEGILLFESVELRNLLDLKIFVDTEADIRLIRKIIRDIKERGRTLESGIHQYLTSTRPMHLEFVEPNKRYADIIIPEGGENRVALELLTARVKEIVANPR
jgi:uridine kinase